MDNPGDAAVQTSSDGGKPQEDSFETTVNTVVSGFKEGDKLPEDLDPKVKVAANAEIRRRHTQGQHAKSQQSLKAAEAENIKLRELIVPQLNLSVEQKEELHDLKSTDPEGWKAKLDKYESEARAKLNTELETISSDSSQEAEKERRAQVLEDFRTANPGFVLNDKVLTNDIPPRITAKLENGKVTFEEFLIEAKDFLTAKKKVGDGNNTSETEPNLNNSGGGHKATENAVKEDAIKSYAKEVY